jgi:hypothetical protein
VFDLFKKKDPLDPQPTNMIVNPFLATALAVVLRYGFLYLVSALDLHEYLAPYMGNVEAKSTEAAVFLLVTYGGIRSVAQSRRKILTGAELAGVTEQQIENRVKSDIPTPALSTPKTEVPKG